MDVIASRVALGADMKKGKDVKTKKKMKKISKPTSCTKSPPNISKKKKILKKEDTLKNKKEILKQTLTNMNINPDKKVKTANETLQKKMNNKILQKVMNQEKMKEPRKESMTDKKVKITCNTSQKRKNEKNQKYKKILQKVKKQKINETEEKIITNKKEVLPKKSSNPSNKLSKKAEKAKKFLQKKKDGKSKTTEIIAQKVKKQKTKKLNEKSVIDKKESLQKTRESQLSIKQVEKGVAAILELVKDEVQSDKKVFDEEHLPIFLQVACIKIPITPSRQLRISLPHSLVSADDDVALIVSDLQRGRRKDYEPTVEHFQKLLVKHNCTQIKTIFPLNQIKTEYDQFELKRNLVSSFDHFLVDGKISGHAARLLGNQFTKKRKLPMSVRMGSKDLKHEIDHALSKTSLHLHSNGDMHLAQIGKTSMQKSEIVDNIVRACKSLADNYPGGWSNIRRLAIKTPKSLAIPIYMTMKSKNKVSTPEVKPKRPKAYRTLEGELSTLPEDSTVSVAPDGTVKIKKKKISMDVIEENENED